MKKRLGQQTPALFDHKQPDQTIIRYFSGRSAGWSDGRMVDGYSDNIANSVQQSWNLDWAWQYILPSLFIN